MSGTNRYDPVETHISNTMEIYGTDDEKNIDNNSEILQSKESQHSQQLSYFRYRHRWSSYLLLCGTILAFLVAGSHRITMTQKHKQQEQANAGTGKPYPRMGHKLQINASAFTVNDYDCLQLDTGNWPSERVHCELRPTPRQVDGNDDEDILMYDFVVEHFDDPNCQQPNIDNPVVRHTSSGCFYFEKYNHSYNDLCHQNRTFTISAFVGRNCLMPLNVTAFNLLPEDGRS